MSNQKHTGPQPTDLASLATAAELYGVSIKTLRRRIGDGTIHGYRLGSLIRVDLGELREKLIIEIPTMR